VASSNVDLVRSIYATWDAWSSFEGWADPDIEFGWADGPSPGSWKGREEVEQGWRDFLSTWDEYRVDVEDCRELDDERVSCSLDAGGAARRAELSLGRYGRRERLCST
jgi:hypothetical protein